MPNGDSESTRLRERWSAWESSRYPADVYPPGDPKSEVDGVDLALADGDAAAILYEHFKTGQLGAANKASLRPVVDDLRRVIDKLDPSARPYFSEALQLLEAVHQSPKSGG